MRAAPHTSTSDQPHLIAAPQRPDTWPPACPGYGSAAPKCAFRRISPAIVVPGCPAERPIIGLPPTRYGHARKSASNLYRAKSGVVPISAKIGVEPWPKSAPKSAATAEKRPAKPPSDLELRLVDFAPKFAPTIPADSRFKRLDEFVPRTRHRLRPNASYRVPAPPSSASPREP